MTKTPRWLIPAGTGRTSSASWDGGLHAGPHF